MAIFSVPEITRRGRRVLDRLDREECIIAFSFHNSYYLSGLPMLQWGRFSITALFTDGDPVLITPDFEDIAAQIYSPITDVRLYKDEDGPSHQVAITMVAQLLAERGIRTAGIEGTGIPWPVHTMLQRQAPDMTFVDASDAIDDVRLVSSPEELRYIREASRLTDTGMQRIVDAAVPGISERELAVLGKQAMEEAARSDYHLNVSCYLQQGTRTANCHGRAQEEPIEAGNFIEVICEAEVEYYQASVERPIIIGTASPAVERAVEVSTQAFDAAVAAVYPGATFGSVDRAGRAVLLEAGYDRIPTGAGLVRSVLHHTGGRTERGQLRMYNDRLLEPEMVLTVEPWAIVPGIGGARHCEVIRVSDEGREHVTAAPGGVLRV